ncbi:hypothetical protein BDB01DRAFT_521481 [Pilobolus umbonatus]|nr:hypothetical protein BDB01DRAFT_521481 [Pilobolus umbonatus]
MIEVGECTEDIESVITKEQVKITEIIEESEKKLITEEGEKPESVVVIDDFHKHIKNTIKEQVKVIKTTVEESSTDNVVSKPIDFEVIETTLKETVTTYVTETKDVCDHKHITDITVVVEEKPKPTVDVIVKETTPKKSIEEVTKKSEVIKVEVVDQPKTTTEVVSIVKTIDDTADVVSRWFSRLTYKINTMIEVGECTEDIESVITKEQVKITEIIEESEKKLITEEGEKPESVVVIDDFHKHIKNTIKEQVKVIKTTVEESSTDNVVSKPIDFEVIETTLKETVTTYVTETKDVCDHKHITDITVIVQEQPVKVIEEKTVTKEVTSEKKPTDKVNIITEDITTVTREVTEEKPKHEVTEVTVVETVKDKKPTDETTIVTEEVTTVTHEITEDKPKHEVTEVTIVETVKDKKPTDEITIVTEEVTTVTREVTEEKPKHEVTEVTVVETVKDKKPTDETTIVTEEVTTVTREITEDKPKHELLLLKLSRTRSLLMKLPLLLKRLPL